MDITPEIVRELLHYDPDTGIFTWRERGEHWFKDRRGWKSWNTRCAGKRAGCVQTNQYGYKRRRIDLLGHEYKEHQLAWIWMKDDPLPPQIDHKNRDATDNRWSNLRASNHVENALNQSMRRDNTSGATGVYFIKRLNKWRARCEVSGRRHNLGLFEDHGEAVREVKKFRADHGFDNGHGKELAPYHAR